jgi:hypothetical protein
MRKVTMMAIGAAIMAVAIPFAAYYWTRPNENPLGEILRRYGFVPINPPSNLMNVGSLYYVDAGVRQFTAICNADKADLDGAVVTSRSWEMQESLERNGRFKTGVHVDIGEAINGSLDKNYAVTLNTSLTDVVLEEIPLGANLSIFQKLMANPQCSKIAMQYLRTRGYVCQGQKILQATAEFRLGRDAQSKLATSANTTPETIKDAVKQAIASQGDQSVVDKEGQRFIGPALKYGVSMNPMCLAPPEGRFSRVLPKSALGRVTNFVLFNIVEPILPARPGGVELAQDTQAIASPR